MSYNHYVSDGPTHYRGAGGFSIAADAKHPAMEVAETGSGECLQQALRFHQQGQTDYATFSNRLWKPGWKNGRSIR